MSVRFVAHSVANRPAQRRPTFHCTLHTAVPACSFQAVASSPLVPLAPAPFTGNGSDTTLHSGRGRE